MGKTDGDSNDGSGQILSRYWLVFSTPVLTFLQCTSPTPFGEPLIMIGAEWPGEAYSAYTTCNGMFIR